MNPELFLSKIVAEMEADEEAAFEARERAETSEERDESRRILIIEAETEAEIPLLRARELRKTSSHPARAYAAAAMG